MSTEYEDMSTSEEERQVEQLSKEQKLDYKEIKDLMTIQGRLKGMIPGFREGIQMQITGRFPGVPTSEIKKYAIPEEGKRADLYLPPPVVEQLSETHDARIPRRYVNPTPGRQGVIMYIEPDLEQDEMLEEDIEGNLTQRILLEVNKAKEQEERKDRQNQEEKEAKGDVVKERETEPEPTGIASEPFPTTSKTSVFVPTDILTEQIATGYLPDDESDGETISSTSTADYDRDEAEDLVDKIASCHNALSTHYNKLCGLIPHMTKTQLGLYLGKIPFTPLVKAEARTVQRDLPMEAAKLEEYSPEIKDPSNTAENQVQDIINQLTADRVLFMIAMGDFTINRHSQRYISKKYNITLSSIQRTLSGDPAHRKGGRQYKAEKKQKPKKITTEKEETTEEEPDRKKSKRGGSEEEKASDPFLSQLPLTMMQEEPVFGDDLYLPDVDI